MTVRDLIRTGSEKIESRWKDTPVLDASVILCHILKISREKLLISYDMEIDNKTEDIFLKAVEKRISGNPVAYITGKKEFFGYDFYVKEGILVPRSDTEILVEEVLKAAEKSADKKIRILDLCTGSGCIAITLSKSLPGAVVDASDISDISEEIFRKNCFSLNEKKINFIKSNLFENITEKYDIIVSNPPYLTDSHVDKMIERDWPEPESALRGGSDGLDFIRIITKEAGNYLKSGGVLAYEADPSQMNKIEQIMKDNSFSEITVTEDLSRRKRVIKGSWTRNDKN